MKISAKHSLFFALAYAAYCAVLCLIFDPFLFIELPSTQITFVLLVPVIFVLLYLLLRFLPRNLSSFSYHLITVIGIYCIPSIGAIVALLLYGTKSSYDLLLFMSTFLIIPLLPIAGYILRMLFHDLKGRVNISAEKVGDSANSVEKIFKIKNDKGKVIIEISVNQIITFEANDNYVITYFVDKEEKLQKSMQRISLKKIEELLFDIEANFLRVHKSYMINPSYVSSVKGRSQAYKIEMNFLSSEIPVSRSFDISGLQS
ncbi:MAG: hypothetical protein ACI8XB_001911 [Patiriisocius sp.]|jgi:hypothetical protein